MIVCLAVVVDGCVCGQPELTELLLKSGADVTVLTANGDTVMHAAVYGNNLHITNMLIKAGGFSLSCNSEDGMQQLCGGGGRGGVL